LKRNRRITARKYRDDLNSWAVLVDGQPFLEDLSRSEVRHYKDEAAAWLAYRERRGDIERDHVVGFKPR